MRLTKADTGPGRSRCRFSRGATAATVGRSPVVNIFAGGGGATSIWAAASSILATVSAFLAAVSAIVSAAAGTGTCATIGAATSTAGCAAAAAGVSVIAATLSRLDSSAGTGVASELDAAASFELFAVTSATLTAAAVSSSAFTGAGKDKLAAGAIMAAIGSGVTLATPGSAGGFGFGANSRACTISTCVKSCCEMMTRAPILVVPYRRMAKSLGSRMQPCDAG